MEIRRVRSGAPWESRVGYCRAVLTGDRISVSGTTAVESDGTVTAVGDAKGQALRCLEIIEAALVELGATRNNITRTRMFVTDISRWEEFGEAHGEFFSDPKYHPTASMIEVSGLIDKNLLIEIEVEAYVGP